MKKKKEEGRRSKEKKGQGLINDMFVVVFQLLWICCCFPAFQRALNPVVFTKMERLKLWDLLHIQNYRCLAFRSSPDVSCSVHWGEVTLGTYLNFLVYCVPSRNPFVSSFDACLHISCCCWVWSSREINTLCGENVALGLICCCSFWPSTWVQADGLLDRQTDSRALRSGGVREDSSIFLGVVCIALQV